jgi:hypothetical protein
MHIISKRTPLTPYYKAAQYLKTGDRRTWLRLKLFYRAVIREEGPDYYKEQFTRTQNVHDYGTRNSRHSFVVTQVRTSSLATSFRFFAVRKWNALPIEVYLSDRGRYVGPDAFGRRLRAHLIERASAAGGCVD